MLAELAACNLAYKTIKQFVGSGRELMDCSSAVIKYFDNKSELAKRVESSSGPKNELEEFLALEKIKSQEAELKTFMIYCGRAGMWNDWQSFQAKAARNRKDAIKNQAKEKYKRQQAALENLNLAIKVGGILIVIMASAFGVAIYLRTY
jgi:hypothetical protein|tara:strand:- start:757 stop:1203 length:447 start_codon:yes stop_codon:yes gene_type:complete